MVSVCASHYLIPPAGLQLSRFRHHRLFHVCGHCHRHFTTNFFRHQGSYAGIRFHTEAFPPLSSVALRSCMHTLTLCCRQHWIRVASVYRCCKNVLSCYAENSSPLQPSSCAGGILPLSTIEIFYCDGWNRFFCNCAPGTKNCSASNSSLVEV